jgi:hypothetical protein
MAVVPPFGYHLKNLENPERLAANVSLAKELRHGIELLQNLQAIRLQDIHDRDNQKAFRSFFNEVRIPQLMTIEIRDGGTLEVGWIVEMIHNHRDSLSSVVLVNANILDVD